jgi:hypothetical protein
MVYPINGVIVDVTAYFKEFLFAADYVVVEGFLPN